MLTPGHLVFVNYRGSDAIWATEYVYARMVAAFGAETVFKAGNALSAGVSFSPVLEEKAATCPVMLACIGPRWLTASTPDGRRRLADGTDWVRREIAIAVAAGNHVVPVLLGDRTEVAVPTAADLPDDIKALVQPHAARLIPGASLDHAMPALVADLERLVPELASRRRDVIPPPPLPLPPERPRTLSIGIEVGELRGRVAAVRGAAVPPGETEIKARARTVSETGELLGVDLTDG